MPFGDTPVSGWGRNGAITSCTLFPTTIGPSDQRLLLRLGLYHWSHEAPPIPKPSPSTWLFIDLLQPAPLLLTYRAIFNRRR